VQPKKKLLRLSDSMPNALLLLLLPQKQLNCKSSKLLKKQQLLQVR
jgi:hypothetical protein